MRERIFAPLGLDHSFFWDGRRVLSVAALEAMRTPQVRAAHFAAAGYDQWGGLGWAINEIDGVQVIEHGGAVGGFQVKVKIVPARRYALAVLTNSGRGCVLGERVAAWALDHQLGLRAASPESIALSNEALARFAGRYRGPGDEAVFTVAGGGLRRVLIESDPATQRELPYPPNQLLPVSARAFIFVSPDEEEGAQIDFIERDDDSIRYLRMYGRLYERVAGGD